MCCWEFRVVYRNCYAGDHHVDTFDTLPAAFAFTRSQNAWRGGANPHDLHGWYQVQRWQSWYQGGSDTAYRADRID
jgi:hypothetical protein